MIKQCIGGLDERLNALEIQLGETELKIGPVCSEIEKTDKSVLNLLKNPESFDKLNDSGN